MALLRRRPTVAASPPVDGASWHQFDRFSAHTHDVWLCAKAVKSRVQRAVREEIVPQCWLLPLVTLAADRQRHEDDWQSVEMAALTAPGER